MIENKQDDCQPYGSRSCDQQNFIAGFNKKELPAPILLLQLLKHSRAGNSILRNEQKYKKN